SLAHRHLHSFPTRRSSDLLFANPEGGVDGLAIDSEGRVYDCSRLGIQVMSPDGKSLGLIPMPRGATTLAFAGHDKKTLYIIGRRSEEHTSELQSRENLVCR